MNAVLLHSPEFAWASTRPFSAVLVLSSRQRLSQMGGVAEALFYSPWLNLSTANIMFVTPPSAFQPHAFERAIWHSGCLWKKKRLTLWISECWATIVAQPTYTSALIVRFTFSALLASSSGDLTTGNRRSPPVLLVDDEVWSANKRVDRISDARRIVTGTKARTEDDMRAIKRTIERCLWGMVTIVASEQSSPCSDVYWITVSDIDVQIQSTNINGAERVVYVIQYRILVDR